MAMQKIDRYGGSRSSRGSRRRDRMAGASPAVSYMLYAGMGQNLHIPAISRARDSQQCLLFFFPQDIARFK